MTVIRTHFERQLQDLQDETLLLGSMVDQAIGRSMEALKRRDLIESQQIVSDDLMINRKRFEIEERCLRLLATQQPMASDLRTIAAILFIVTDLERMADHAEGIAKISLLIGDQALVKPLVDMPKMADHARSMLHQALDAFINRDVDTAKAVAAQDDYVDGLYDRVYHELLGIMIEDRDTITMATYLLWAAHNLERVADRVTNICERVAYAVTGQMEEINVSKY